MTKRLIVAIVAIVAIGAACGNSAEPEKRTEPAGPAAPTQQAGGKCTNERPAPPAKEDNVSSKPDVKIPDGDPPCELISDDIKEGSGAEAKASDTVTVQYVGVSWSTRKEFDSSWDRGQPATFSLDQVVKGWGQGIPGMKEGGRRRLIIPPALGYGARGQGPIAPNETLVFVVDLVKVGA
jgi:peptidylprolyl isomerase